MKKKLVSKVIAIGLMSMLVALTGCSGGSVKATNNKANAYTESIGQNGESISFPLEETATLNFITNAPASSTQNPNERVIFQRLEEQTNVRIDWTCFVEDQFADKKNLALSKASSLPDGLFIAGMSDYDLLRYAKQGVIIPLEELIEEYMPNLSAIFEEYPEYRAMATAADGHIYGFPWIEQLGEGKEAIQSIGNIPFINKTWLDALGLPVPSTIAELEVALQAFKDNDMAGDGQTIPMTFIVNGGNEDPGVLLGAFGEGYGDVPGRVAVTNDKEVIFTAAQEGYRDGIAWLHTLYQKGLIDLEAFTQDWQTFVAKGKAGRYGLFFTWDSANIVEDMNDYIPLPALEGPNGMKNIPRFTGSATSGFDRGRSVLTSKCVNPALAAAWIDQMYVPMQSAQNNWGSYGETERFNIFEMSTNADGEPMLKHMDLGSESPVEVRVAQSVGGPLAIMNAYYDKYVTCPDDAAYRLAWIKDIYVQDMNQEYVYPNVFMSQEDTNKLAQLNTDIDTYADQMKASWIMDGGIEEEWDAYLQKLNEYGLQEVLSIRQKYFDNYIEQVEK